MKPKQISKVAIVRELAKLADIPRVQASFIYDVINDITIRKIREGHDIILPNIGTLRLIPGRQMISNLTGQLIPAHKRLKFKVNLKLARYMRVNTREFKIK
jgi:nucleoid DNA-binding protein